VGIDVEGWDNLRFDDLRNARAFSAAELARLMKLPAQAIEGEAVDPRSMEALRTWVRKECLIKLGLLSLDTLSQCDASSPAVAHGIADLCFSEWTDSASRTCGAVACGHPIRVTMLE